MNADDDKYLARLRYFMAVANTGIGSIALVGNLLLALLFKKHAGLASRSTVRALLYAAIADAFVGLGGMALGAARISSFNYQHANRTRPHLLCLAANTESCPTRVDKGTRPNVANCPRGQKCHSQVDWQNLQGFGPHIWCPQGRVQV